MTMYKVWYLRDDAGRLYVLRKGGQREFACIKDGVDLSIRRLEDYVKKSKKRFWLQWSEITLTTQRSREQQQNDHIIRHKKIVYSIYVKIETKRSYNKRMQQICTKRI